MGQSVHYGVLRFQSTPPMQGATLNGQNPLFEWVFQSTPPMQGATRCIRLYTFVYPVSIHAPYAGSDNMTKKQGTSTISSFQSTPPMQGATIPGEDGGKYFRVSIHAPYAGSDHSASQVCSLSRSFNPRPLCRERLHLNPNALA